MTFSFFYFFLPGEDRVGEENKTKQKKKKNAGPVRLRIYYGEQTNALPAAPKRRRNDAVVSSRIGSLFSRLVDGKVTI